MWQRVSWKWAKFFITNQIILLPTNRMSFPRSVARMHVIHVPRTGEHSTNKRPRVSTMQKGGRKVFRMTDLVCDRQISEGHLGKEEDWRRRRWRPATDTKKVTIRNSLASDGASGIYTTCCGRRGENVFGSPQV